MTTANNDNKLTYEQFREQWLTPIENGDLSPLGKGRLFAANLITQWLGVTTDDDDFFVCDGPGDGGIDVAYLKRADIDTANLDDNAEEGDTWYLVQSKYGTAFTGTDTIRDEGDKVIGTLQGQNQNLSDDTRQLMQKLDLFRKQASDSDQITLVFATTDPITQEDRQSIEDLKLIGRERVGHNFDVKEVSLLTIWEALDDTEQPRLSVSLKGKFVEQSSGLLVGTVSLVDLFQFLQSFQKQSGNLDQLYAKNVRQFLGPRRKVNKGIANTLNEVPEKFGLYNNGITIVVQGYLKSSIDDTITMNEPYIVNGCQTTRTIWQVLDSKLHAGGTGQDTATSDWRERVSFGGVVTKIVSSDEAEIANITQFTNLQNGVREQDFVALHDNFQSWKVAMQNNYRIFLEIQRGGIEAQKAYEKQRHPGQPQYVDYVNAFDLIKVYGAGWLGAPGLAFGKNAPFLPPQGSVYQRIVSPQNSEPGFGASDLYAAYKIKCVADEIGFGRNAESPSRRQSRFLFYHIIMRMLSNVILLTPGFRPPPVSGRDLTEAVLKLSDSGNEMQIAVLRNAAIVLLDQYLTVGSDLTLGSANSAHNESSFKEIHNGNLNGFLKAESLGRENHSPLLVQMLAQHNQAFASIPMPGYEGNPTQREFVAKALIDA